MKELSNITDVTKSDINDVMIQSFIGIPSKVVSSASKIIFDILADNLVQGYRIEVRGFGSFSVRYRPPRNAHNPRNGEKVTTLGKYTPHFKAGNSLKARIDSLTKDQEFTRELSETEIA